MNNQTQRKEIDDLIEFFNSTTVFEKVQSLNDYELSNLTASIFTFGFEQIKNAITKANNSRFLTGRKGYEWKASFGWIINPEHIASILGGKYDDYRRAPRAENNPYAFIDNPLYPNPTRETGSDGDPEKSPYYESSIYSKMSDEELEALLKQRSDEWLYQMGVR